MYYLLGIWSNMQWALASAMKEEYKVGAGEGMEREGGSHDTVAFLLFGPLASLRPWLSVYLWQIVEPFYFEEIKLAIFSME